jgi:hypothetical protein
MVLCWRRGFLLVAGIGLVVALSHCSSGGDNPPLASVTPAPGQAIASSVVGAGGGTVTSSDGNLNVVIPSGALSTDTTISIAPATGTPANNVGPVYEVGPSGTEFKVAVTMTFKFSPFDLQDHAISDLHAGTVTDGKWVALANPSADPTKGMVSGTTLHLSPYGVFASDATTPAAQVCVKRDWSFPCGPSSGGGASCPPPPTCTSYVDPSGARPCDVYAGSLMTGCETKTNSITATCCFPQNAPTCFTAADGCHGGGTCTPPSCDQVCASVLPGRNDVTVKTCQTANGSSTAVCCLPAGTPLPALNGADEDAGPPAADGGGSDSGAESDSGPSADAGDGGPDGGVF